MRIELCLLLPCLLGVQCLRRGPHHPHAQTSVDRRHHHYRPSSSGSLTAESQLLRDQRHIEEDAHVLTAEDILKMSPEELEFHYFLAHDFDKNSMLDGLELLKAVYHTNEDEETEPGHDLDDDSSIEPGSSNSLESYIALVDRTLFEDDVDNDGFVSYAEYRAARSHNDVTKPKRTPHVLAALSP